jgi:hypothetical protein
VKAPNGLLVLIERQCLVMVGAIRAFLFASFACEWSIVRAEEEQESRHSSWTAVPERLREAQTSALRVSFKKEASLQMLLQQHLKVTILVLARRDSQLRVAAVALHTQQGVTRASLIGMRIPANPTKVWVHDMTAISIGHTVGSPEL